MKNSNYYFFNNDSSKGMASLGEIVANFESSHPSFNGKTWVRGEKDLYWSVIEYTKEIALYLHWDIVDKHGKILTFIEGKELVDLFERRIINDSSQVKLSCGYVWKKYRWTVLYEIKDKIYEFQGIAAKLPGYKNRIARAIDVICYSFLPIFFSKFLIEELAIIIAVMEMLFPILSSYCEAHFITRLGGTIGMKINGLNILNSDGTKLTFSQALSRQWALNSNRGWRFKSRCIEKSLYPFGAIKWDRDHGCIITEQIPK